ncbi:helix-turn-helix transcriptional regulator [Sphingobium chlorophenolicum]|uniref:LuxR-family transcriptional regulator n=1 Tax=Sphingobium chlorophenolicum TaxID=46429 RepID=A0A081R9F5_SPHCR|nr:autoinducer binding domain-containing protein [Sphingobium chlorophenolicum]KEQ51828.1 LuxR-family transcriptional regulator [Sphingobium chlorophenolicum]
MSVQYNVQEFLNDIERVQNPDDMAMVLSDIAGTMGFQYFAITQHVDVLAANGMAIHIHNYPAHWADFYAANALGLSDPVHRACHMTDWGFRWTSISSLIPLTRNDKAHLDCGRREGIGDGFTVPSNVGGYPPGSCSFANADGVPIPDDKLWLAQLVGSCAFHVARRLWLGAVRRGTRNAALTDRQRECVQWMALGKNDDEAGEILGIRKGTVTKHIKDSCSRYEVNKRVMLIGLALADGTLTISDIGGWRHSHLWE